MYHLEIMPAARKDIVNILRYSERTWGQTQQERYREQLENALLNLRCNPTIGLKRNQFFEGCLLHYVGKHVIIFRLQTDTLQVIRVLHQRMKISKHLQSDSPPSSFH
jgi:toxin ParE1/3/4